MLGYLSDYNKSKQVDTESYNLWLAVFPPDQLYGRLMAQSRQRASSVAFFLIRVLQVGRAASWPRTKRRTRRKTRRKKRTTCMAYSCHSCPEVPPDIRDYQDRTLSRFDGAEPACSRGVDLYHLSLGFHRLNSQGGGPLPGRYLNIMEATMNR